MGANAIDKRDALRIAQATLPAAAVALPAADLLHSEMLEGTSILLCVIGIGLFARVRGNRPADVAAALGIVAAYVAAASYPEPLTTLFVCIASLSLLAAYLVAGHDLRAMQGPQPAVVHDVAPSVGEALTAA